MKEMHVWHGRHADNCDCTDCCTSSCGCTGCDYIGGRAGSRMCTIGGTDHCSYTDNSNHVDGCENGCECADSHSMSYNDVDRKEGSTSTVLARPFYFNSTLFAFTGSTDDRTYPIPADRPVRIYCDGIYDLFHYGHMRSLMQAKHIFPNVHLIVGVASDSTTLTNKGCTVYTEKERAECVRHCRYVDEVVENAPWIIDEAFIRKHGIDYVCHDNIPYSGQETSDVYRGLKESGRFIATRRTCGISTTKIITRIVKDYDQFVRRQLERGIRVEDLNLPFLKKESMMVKDTIRNIETDLKKEIEDIKNELKIALLYWESVSNDMVRSFGKRFSRGVDEEGLFRKVMRKIVKMIKKEK